MYKTEDSDLQEMYSNEDSGQLQEMHNTEDPVTHKEGTSSAMNLTDSSSVAKALVHRKGITTLLLLPVQDTVRVHPSTPNETYKLVAEHNHHLILFFTLQVFSIYLASLTCLASRP